MQYLLNLAGGEAPPIDGAILQASGSYILPYITQFQLKLTYHSLRPRSYSDEYQQDRVPYWRQLQQVLD
jgi:hypothetical protein